MVSVTQDISLGDAASQFLAELPPEEKGTTQREINNFVRWFGSKRQIAAITPAEIDNFAERLSLSDTDYQIKLELVRAFLVYSNKKNLTKTNLSIHLKARKVKTRAKQNTATRQNTVEAVMLTRQGYAELEAELADLRNKRLAAIDEIRKAAADKDFRENVPLEAARELRGQLEGRIIKLEETLKSAVIMDDQKKDTLKVCFGDTVVLCDMTSNEQCRYMLVSPREVDPGRGKISSSSPVGKAVLGKKQGETIEVVVPVGKLCYQIKQIEH